MSDAPLHVPEDDAVVWGDAGSVPEDSDTIDEPTDVTRYVVSCDCVDCALSHLRDEFDEALELAEAHIDETLDNPDGLEHDVSILPSPRTRLE